MKKLFTLLALATLSMPLFAQVNSSTKMVETFYYDRGNYKTSEQERAKLNGLITEMRADSTLKVHIVGYCDKWGGEAVNKRFSYVRAIYISDWLRYRKVPREQITFAGSGIDTAANNDAEARRVEIMQLVTSNTTQKKEYAEETTSQSHGNFSLRTNLVYWLGGMANIGFEYKPKKSNVAILLNGGYSPLKSTNWSIGGWFAAPELRCYLSQRERWFIGAQLLAAGYNIFVSEMGYQGSLIGGGITGGYKLHLREHFAMDFTLGIGYGKFKHDSYYYDDATGNYQCINEGVVRYSLMPLQAGVNLIWKIK